MSMAPGALFTALEGLNESLWHTWIRSKYRGWSSARPHGPTIPAFTFWPNYRPKPNMSSNLAQNDSLGQQGHYPERFQISLYCFWSPRSPVYCQTMRLSVGLQRSKLRGERGMTGAEYVSLFLHAFACCRLIEYRQLTNRSPIMCVKWAWCIFIHSF